MWDLSFIQHKSHPKFQLHCKERKEANGSLSLQLWASSKCIERHCIQAVDRQFYINCMLEFEGSRSHVGGVLKGPDLMWGGV